MAACLHVVLPLALYLRRSCWRMSATLQLSGSSLRGHPDSDVAAVSVDAARFTVHEEAVVRQPGRLPAAEASTPWLKAKPLQLRLTIEKRIVGATNARIVGEIRERSNNV